MKDRLTPIILTLIILLIVFGAWFAGRQQGWFMSKSSDDFNICLIGSDTISIQYKAPDYGITGWSSRREDNDNVLHIEVEISRWNQRGITVIIDTSEVEYIELYGKNFLIKDLQICK
ncbi:hypothetical protein [Prevotella sp. 10(H)]|uniref:hypothetical protein n=1 Tax=Prevotella sp. 10(H) TaxID=1158294 RepID=UPI0004A6B9B0|nr:hypothetical protein [Prevotella sp. 10(H)]